MRVRTHTRPRPTHCAAMHFCNGRIYPHHAASRDIAKRDSTKLRYNPSGMLIIARLRISRQRASRFILCTCAQWRVYVPPTPRGFICISPLSRPLGLAYKNVHQLCKILLYYILLLYFTIFVRLFYAFSKENKFYLEYKIILAIISFENFQYL